MNGVTQWALGTAALWLIIGGLAVSEVRGWYRNRRADARSREAVRTADPGELSAWLPRETATALAGGMSTGESA